MDVRKARIEGLVADARLPRRVSSQRARYTLYAHLSAAEGVRSSGSTYLWPDESGSIRLFPGQRAWIPLGFRMSLFRDASVRISPIPERMMDEGLSVMDSEAGLLLPEAPHARVLVMNAGLEEIIVRDREPIAEMTVHTLAEPIFHMEPLASSCDMDDPRSRR